jgi:amino acid transporter/mannitol/fructose-specific phosphotransferase system IIA component (Ntr-type)/nucleotide-binding universal stress UspA family protein
VQKLERRIELGGVVAISISAMMGSGIFVLPGLAAIKTGTSVWLAYLLAGLCVLPAALSKAELATAMPTSGGTYVYIERVFGPLAGTIAGLGLWLSLLLKSAFALVGFGAYASMLVPYIPFIDAVPLKETAIVILILSVAMNIAGVKRVSQAQKIVVLIALGCMTGLVVRGTFNFQAAQLAPVIGDEGWGGLLSAVGFVFVSYAGVTKVAAIAEEVKRPERNLPLGILLSLLVATVLYAAVALVTVGVIGVETLKGDMHPVYTLADALMGPVLGIPAAILGVLTMASMANAGLLASSRFPFAMSREKLLPAALSQLNPRFMTPVWCILLSGGIIAGAILLFEVDKIAKLASSFMIMLFALVQVSVIVLRETGVKWYRPPYRAPLYPWVQLFGIFSAVVLLSVMGVLALAASVAIVIPGALVFIAYGRKHAKRRGVLSTRAPRRDLLSGESKVPVPAGEMDEDSIVPQPRDSLKAPVVVKLRGDERSPETLVDLGAALAEGRHVEVAHVTEVPPQTELEAFDETALVQSVRRRVEAMADDKGFDLELHSLASHDLAETAHALTEASECEWLVMEWAGRREEAFTFERPLGWLQGHLDTNVAIFRDVGVRYIRRILVLPDPGLHDSLVAHTAEVLAKAWGAELCFAHFSHRGEKDVGRVQSYLKEIASLVDIDSETLVLRGKDEVRAVVKESAAYDLVVVSEGQVSLLERIRGSNADRITAGATCSVLRLQSPRARGHESYAREARVPEPMELLRERMRGNAGAHCLPPMRKDALFAYMARVLADACDRPEKDVAEALWEREKLQNTAVGDGLALSHGTLDGVGSTLAVFKLEEPIDYRAPDKQTVDIVFASVGSPEERSEHLKLLSAIARSCKETDLLERVRAARSDAELRAVFGADE